MCGRAMSSLVEVVVMLGVRALTGLFVGVLCVGGGRLIGSDRIGGVRRSRGCAFGCGVALLGKSIICNSLSRHACYRDGMRMLCRQSRCK